MKTSLLALAVTVAVAATGAVRGAEPLADEAKAAMAKATTFLRSISTEGGYLWRYSTDLKVRAGENDATATQIWVQPPGTPEVGMIFLRAHEVTGDARYLEAAKAAADALAIGQLESGGWDYLVDFDPKQSVNWYRRTDVGKLSAADAAKRRNTSTYDDDNTQSALRLLLAVADTSKGSNDPRDVRIREARDYGLKKLLEVQRPNGGWPQRWPGTPVTAADYPDLRASFPANWPREHQRENYNGHYTLNDNTHRDCVMTLFDAHRRLGKKEFRDAALRGGNFLIGAQLPEPQPGWAQQYNPQMQPSWARAFEPPSVCSNESGGVMRLLVDLYLETGEEKFLEPLPRAIAWFKRSEIAPGRWARLYELGTNKPIYGDRDGKVHYTVEELTPERRNGYSWQGPYGVAAAIAHYEAVKATGREKFLAKRDAKPSAADKAARARALEPRVKSIIAALDAEGRWAADFRGAPTIRTETFNANVRVLCDYLDAVK
jgi:hypothetical protein